MATTYRMAWTLYGWAPLVAVLVMAGIAIGSCGHSDYDKFMDK